ncbi:hypothetical protein [Pseudoalteromonas aurantia]|uniref:Uncharacterized protein n=1 Tax=Pseudoalteromonas aurantia 208 TaxID=1314867 RepID=A0ABR9EI17_9GAMM|nr:hypothetical protein [Pseudoalteromonas aurantia]MBE0370382.1 hypothetical protein [Pseudoalteromonas aurantia 208]
MKLKFSKKPLKCLSTNTNRLSIGNTPLIAGGAGQNTGNTAYCDQESNQNQCGPTIPIVLTAYTACDCPTALNVCGPN